MHNNNRMIAYPDNAIVADISVDNIVYGDVSISFLDNPYVDDDIDDGDIESGDSGGDEEENKEGGGES